MNEENSFIKYLVDEGVLDGDISRWDMAKINKGIAPKWAKKVTEIGPRPKRPETSSSPSEVAMRRVTEPNYRPAYRESDMKADNAAEQKMNQRIADILQKKLDFPIAATKDDITINTPHVRFFVYPYGFVYKVKAVYSPTRKEMKDCESIAEVIQFIQACLSKDMQIETALGILKDNGAEIIKEDTDEYDDADLGINVNPKEYHKQKGLMKSLKDRIIDVYEEFIHRKEKEAEQSWKKNVKYRAGTNDEDSLMENYEDCWNEKFPHKNTMTPFEFYKVMMSNYDTRDFIKSKTGKQMGNYVQPDHDDDDDDDTSLEKPKNGDFEYCQRCCKSPTNKKKFIAEIKSLLSKAKTAKEFIKLAAKRGDNYFDMWDKLDDKIDNLEDKDKPVPKEMKEECQFFSIMNDCLEYEIGDEDEWIGMCCKEAGTIQKVKKVFEILFAENFSTNAAKKAAAFVLGKSGKEKKGTAKKSSEQQVPPIVKVMYKSFMEKMKVKYIYRAVNVDTEWVDDQLDDMEDKWNQEDKAEYLRKNKYKERMGLANVNLHAVGKSWAWAEDEADDVCGGDGDTYIIEAENDPANVDLPMSALCFAEWSHFKNNGTVGGGECEVRVLNELDVTVTDVFIGKGKNKTHLNRRETYYREEN